MSGTYAYQSDMMMHSSDFSSPAMFSCTNLAKAFRAGAAIFAALAFLIYVRDSILVTGSIAAGILLHGLGFGIRRGTTK